MRYNLVILIFLLICSKTYCNDTARLINIEYYAIPTDIVNRYMFSEGAVMDYVYNHSNECCQGIIKNQDVLEKVDKLLKKSKFVKPNDRAQVSCVFILIYSDTVKSLSLFPGCGKTIVLNSEKLVKVNKFRLNNILRKLNDSNCPELLRIYKTRNRKDPSENYIDR